MRTYIEYISSTGVCMDLKYATLKTKIIQIDSVRGPSPGELRGHQYKDLILKPGSQAIFSKRKRSQGREIQPITLEQLTALSNGLGVRKSDELRGMEVIALYDISNDRLPKLLGFIRPQDKVEIEEV